MSAKKVNPDIKCRVDSCRYHGEDENYCTLSCIQVEPCQGNCSGKACDESMCGSYRQK